MTTTTATKATTIHGASERIASRVPFTAGGDAYGEPNFRGGPNEGTMGSLPHDYREQFYAEANGIDYVVYSYHTPIAWHHEVLGWTVPPVKYSISTTRHQGALGQIK